MCSISPSLLPHPLPPCLWPSLPASLSLTHLIESLLGFTIALVSWSSSLPGSGSLCVTWPRPTFPASPLPLRPQTPPSSRVNSFKFIFCPLSLAPRTSTLVSCPFTGPTPLSSRPRWFPFLQEVVLRPKAGSLPWPCQCPGLSLS